MAIDCSTASTLAICVETRFTFEEKVLQPNSLPKRIGAPPRYGRKSPIIAGKSPDRVSSASPVSTKYSPYGWLPMPSSRRALTSSSLDPPIVAGRQRATTPFAPIAIVSSSTVAQEKPLVMATLWEEQATLAYSVVISKGASNQSVARRADNNMINGTKLLNIANMSRGKRDAQLAAQDERQLVKEGSVHFKGVWLPFGRALKLARKFNLVQKVWPLFEPDLSRYVCRESNALRTQQLLNAAHTRPHLLKKQPDSSDGYLNSRTDGLDKVLNELEEGLRTPDPANAITDSASPSNTAASSLSIASPTTRPPTASPSSVSFPSAAGDESSSSSLAFEFHMSKSISSPSLSSQTVQKRDCRISEREQSFPSSCVPTAATSSWLRSWVSSQLSTDGEDHDRFTEQAIFSQADCTASLPASYSTEFTAVDPSVFNMSSDYAPVCDSNQYPTAFSEASLHYTPLDKSASISSIHPASRSYNRYMDPAFPANSPLSGGVQEQQHHFAWSANATGELASTYGYPSPCATTPVSLPRLSPPYTPMSTFNPEPECWWQPTASEDYQTVIGGYHSGGNAACWSEKSEHLGWSRQETC